MVETNFFEMMQDEETVSKWWESLSDEEVLKLAEHPDPDRDFSELAIFTQIKIYHHWKSLYSDNKRAYEAYCTSQLEFDRDCEHKSGERCLLIGECNWKSIIPTKSDKGGMKE